MFFVFKIEITSSENVQVNYLCSVVFRRGRGVIIVLRLVNALAEEKKKFTTMLRQLIRVCMYVQVIKCHMCYETVLPTKYRGTIHPR